MGKCKKRREKTMHIILDKGAHSTVFTDSKTPGIVIKQNNNPHQPDTDYLRRQSRGYDIIKSIKSKNRDIGVMLPQLIEMRDFGNRQIIKEKIIPGQPLTHEIYSKLSEQEKNKIAQQIAIFLNAMHQSFKCEPAKKSIIHTFSQSNINTASDIVVKFDGKLPANIVRRLKQAEKYLLTSDTSDEFIVMTHKDLRTQNIMYDKKTGNLAVLDFELAGPDNIYRDFIPSAPASAMPWDFIKRVIEFYNNIPNKKYQLTINSKKVQNMLLFRIMHEFARCIKPNDNKRTTKKDINKIRIITGINFDIKSAFGRGTKNIQRAQNFLQKIFHNIFNRQKN